MLAAGEPGLAAESRCIATSSSLVRLRGSTCLSCHVASVQAAPAPAANRTPLAENAPGSAAGGGDGRVAIWTVRPVDRSERSCRWPCCAGGDRAVSLSPGMCDSVSVFPNANLSYQPRRSLNDDLHY